MRLHYTLAEGYDTAGNLVRNCEKSVRNLARNQKSGPVEIRKSARNHEKSGNPREITSYLSMRSRPFAHAHLRNHARNQRHEAGNQQVRFGNAIAIFETKPLYEKRQIYSGATRVLSL